MRTATLHLIPGTAPTEAHTPTVEERQNQLRAEWAAIETDRQAGIVQVDVRQADLLARYEAPDMTQRKMAECLGIGQAHVKRLLRYARFMASLSPMGLKIPERQFREHWKTYADTHALRQLRGKNQAHALAAYEAKVFARIVEVLASPDVSVRPARRKRTHAVKPDKAVVQKKRKEVAHIYDEIKEDVDNLIHLAGADRATYAPGMLAMHAKRLKKGFRELDEALKDLLPASTRDQSSASVVEEHSQMGETEEGGEATTRLS
jgi:hypothetical protein